MYVVLRWSYSRSFIFPISSAIIQNIEGLPVAELAAMAYYYCDFRVVKTQQDLYGLFSSSLLSQLSAKSNSCYDVLSKLYSNNARRTGKPDNTALTECIKEMLCLPGQGPINIIIDALDEYPNISGTPSVREKVLKLIEELVLLNLPNVHICVTSRPEVDIRTVLEPLTSLEISLHDQTGQKEDIVKYIRFIIQSDRKMRKWREEDKQLVIDVLSEKANGMYVILCGASR
jgi:hypothetical protein